jgi:peptidoglycan hydrolase-like amidase
VSLAAHEPLPLAMRVLALRSYALTKSEAEAKDAKDDDVTNQEMLQVYKAVTEVKLNAAEVTT